MSSNKILIGISQCLLGTKVRFDGGHKHDRYITDTLGRYFDFQPYCPEVAIGLGVPREPIRLVGDVEHPRLVGTKNESLDVTNKMIDYSDETCRQLPKEMCGFILKSKSPTCGMERVTVYHTNGNPNTKTQGLFAKALLQQNPWLPIEEEGRLCDPVIRENFIERVFILRRWKDLTSTEITADKLLQFHAQHKLALMAHHGSSFKVLGNLLSNLKGKNLIELGRSYILQMMQAFKYKATPAKNTNVLQHCAGYLKKSLDNYERQALAKVIDRYRIGEIPFIVPITLLQHYFGKYPDDYMLQQSFLNPYPNELSLRNAL